MKQLGWKVGIAVVGMAAGMVLAQGPGYGPGRGWMAGYGPGPGMMAGSGYGYGPRASLSRLDLSDEQRDRISALQDQHRRDNWNRMSEMRAEQLKLRGLYRSDSSDTNAIAEQQKKVDALRRQMFDSQLAARNEIDAVLTPEQRKQLGR